MGLRASLLFELSRHLMPPPATRTVDYQAYQDWRTQSLSRSWDQFSDDDIRGKDVLDFGCGDGALSRFLAANKAPRSVTAIDLDAAAVARAREALKSFVAPPGVKIEIVQGAKSALPVPDQSVDTLVAFDCLEHVMSPLDIFRDWRRVLRPGGKCLVEWFPYKGPWGPHMESLVPVPWAHVLFGQAAMFRAAERMYDSPTFVPRHWDLDESGAKKPNKWKNWSSFKQQGYINELDLRTFRRLVEQAGLKVHRLELQSFGGAPWRKFLGRVLMNTPLVGEYFLSFAVIELRRP